MFTFGECGLEGVSVPAYKGIQKLFGLGKSLLLVAVDCFNRVQEGFSLDAVLQGFLVEVLRRGGQDFPGVFVL